MPISPVTMTVPHADDVVIRRMSVIERLGQPFEFRVDLASKVGNLKFEDFLGRPATVHLELPRGGTRHFNGVVASFGQTAVDGDSYQFQAVLRPWFWLLTRTTDCRIFQNLSVPDIVKAVCSDLGFTDYKLQLSDTYSPREYCVQYRESAFSFISRLLEAEGIYYYFTHEENKHHLVLSDGVDSHQPFAAYETIPFAPDRLLEERVTSWNASLELQSGKYVLNDFDFQNPKADLNTKLNVDRSHPHAGFEVYDYPGCYSSTSIGNSYVRARIEERQAQYQIVRAGSDVRGIATGSLFSLTDHPCADQNQEYLVVSTIHEIVNPEIEADCSHECQFEVIPSSQTFRPPRLTAKPLISGPQTAIVVGKSGNEIWTDSFGRVKVQFHWDRMGKKDENSSCWIRVAQSWAGKKWGSQFLPRIGQEVVVEFLEGDPDRPLITGSVYNQDQPVPYALPDHATQSGVKSRSTKEGDDETFNELRFEDKKDSEEIYFHAEKDFNRVVENNDTLKVGYKKKDKGDQTIDIYNNQKLVVGGGGTDAADGSQTIEIQKDRTATLKTGNEKLEVQEGNRNVIVTKGNDAHTISAGNRAVTIDQGNDTLTITQGNQTISISSGKCSITAGTSIELTVGGSSIKIEPSKITLTSVEIDITADTKIAAKGAMIQAQASGTLILKGGMVQIN